MISYLNSFALHYERLISIMGSGFEHIVTMNIRNAITNRMQRTDRQTGVVAGGGIAGLAAAVALTQAGWQVTVLERAPAFGEVGAGLGFTGNGMAALGALGVAEAVRAGGHLRPPAR